MHKSEPKAQLAIIGTGDQRSSLERLALTLDVPVTLLGALPQVQKVHWLNRAWAVLCPSAKEGWGMVCIEAMACGTPVIASDVEGHRDSVLQHIGYRCPAGDALAMAERTIQLFESAPLRLNLREKGIEWAARFDWDEVARAIEDVLSRAAGQKASQATTRRSMRGVRA